MLRHLSNSIAYTTIDKNLLKSPPAPIIATIEPIGNKLSSVTFLIAFYRYLDEIQENKTPQNMQSITQ